jgi:ribose 5-phosphate isomerase B
MIIKEKMLPIALGCDHRGFNLKQAIISFIVKAGYSYQDFGCYNMTSVDYPDIAREVAGAVARGECNFGILVCSSGIGMSIAANKMRGIRAALCHDSFTAGRARQHNDANILCLGGDILRPESVNDVVQTFLNTEFEGGRHARRLEKIKDMETCQE